MTKLTGQFRFFLGTALLCAAASADEEQVLKYPHVMLRRGGVELLICMPDAEQGINRAMRFDRSGFVARAVYENHTWFGMWHETADPYRNDNVMGTAGEFGMGTNGMPAPLGFEEAKEGEPFLKIGVGLLKKQGDEYRFGGVYEVIRAGEWQVSRNAGSIEFEQRLDSGMGYAYRYKKRIAICKELPGFVVAYELENTGTRAIAQTYYAHNFIKIDDHPIGPDYEVIFPQAMTPDRDLKGIAAIEGNSLTFLRSMQPKESVYAQFIEHDLMAAANGAWVRNKASGAAIRITGNAALSRYHFWSMEKVACPEPFVSLNVAPRETFRWQDTYELIVEP